jgi:ubiquinone biosynthesis UbiH/UbiF/VisC/COQ6 family hydroxylase
VHAGIAATAGAAVSALRFTAAGWRLCIDGQRDLRAPLVIAADGAASAIRTLAAGAVRVRDSGQSALTAIVEHTQPHGGTALQVFLDTGPLAFLPLPAPAGRHRSSVVWSLDRDALRAIAGLADEDFHDRLSAHVAACVGGAGSAPGALPEARGRERLGQHLPARFGRVVASGPRATFPLVQQHALRYQPAEGVVLIGDAAHVVHPLAGQGMNLALRDARLLVDALGAPRTADLAARLDRFERRARAANGAALLLFDALRRTFAGHGPWWRFARSRGMRLVDASPPLRRLLAREAIGRGLLTG